MNLTPIPEVCTVCGATLVPGEAEARSLAIQCGELAIAPRSDSWNWEALDDERAYACGQRDTLVLTERYLERGTFAPADHNLLPMPSEQADGFPDLH